MANKKNKCHAAAALTVRLGDTLNLILLLDRVRVAALLGAVHDLVRQALADRFDVTEGRVTGSDADQVDGLVHTTDRGHIHGLSSDDTGASDTGGILTGTTVLDGIGEHLNRVLTRQEVHDLKGLLDNADGLHLLTRVSAVHHEGAHEALDDRAQGLTEPPHLVPSLGVGQVDGVRALAADVVHEGQVLRGDGAVIEGPPTKELGLLGLVELTTGRARLLDLHLLYILFILALLRHVLGVDVCMYRARR